MAHHINTNTGEVSRCKAQKGGCPFGGESGSDNHFSTPEEARAGAEKLMAATYGTVSTPQRKQETANVVTERMTRKINKLNAKAAEALRNGDFGARIKAEDKIQDIWKKHNEGKQPFLKSLFGGGNPDLDSVEPVIVDHSHHSEPEPEPIQEAPPGVEMVPCGKCSVCDPPPSEMTHFHSYHLNMQCAKPVPAQ